MTAEKCMEEIYNLLLWPTEDVKPPFRSLGEAEVHNRIKEIVMHWKANQLRENLNGKVGA